MSNDCVKYVFETSFEYMIFELSYKNNLLKTVYLMAKYHHIILFYRYYVSLIFN